MLAWQGVQKEGQKILFKILLIEVFTYLCHPEKRGSSFFCHFSSAGRATDL